MNDPVPQDARSLVRRGYDACAAAYEAARRRQPAHELDPLWPHLAQGARVLDLGCGAGLPIAAALARSCILTGIDQSAEQICRARRNVRQATFLCTEFMQADFPSSSFEAVVSFYAIFHLPRTEHAELFRRIHHWLIPGGLLLASLSYDDQDGIIEEDFFGVKMYWSSFDLQTSRALLRQAGFEILEQRMLGHGYGQAEFPEERHPLILARAV